MNTDGFVWMIWNFVMIFMDEVKKRWEEINTDNVSELADVDGYWEDFYRMFGFKEEGIDYEAETDPVVEIPSIKE